MSGNSRHIVDMSVFLRERNLLTSTIPAAFRMSVLNNHFCTRPQLCTMEDNSPTAGIIIIGDEILKGHVMDTNSRFISRRLFALGVRVRKISVISDDLDIIAKEVAEFSQSFTHVITSGGVGPTHDDLTFEGVAKAFGEETVPHPHLVELCKEFFGTDDLKSPKLKMALIPESAKLHFGVNERTKQKSKYPLVNVRNVYMFPGVPQLLEKAFDMLQHLFINPHTTFYVREVYVDRDEVSITPIINETDEKFHDRVVLGSYPDFYNSYYKVKLTLESENRQHVDEAQRFLMDNLPHGSVVKYEKDPCGTAAEHVYDLVTSKDSSPLAVNVRHAVSVIEKAFERYKAEEICVGFNGGKDCTALLHLTYAVYRTKYPDETRKLQALYIRRGQPFPEIELFTKLAKDNYHLEIITIHGRIKEALFEMKSTHPTLKAVIMGSRRSDPYCGNLNEFSPTDPGWPEYMRINPILDWSYKDVWTFIRTFNIPYCSLYDRGYTSLGSMENTHPNPALQVVDSKGIISYKPAYMLANGDSERAGRN